MVTTMASTPIAMESACVRTDVTAVGLFNDIVVAGVGSNLMIFDRSTHAQLHRSCVLTEQKIHGLAWRDGVLLVFGGKQAVVARVERAGAACGVRRAAALETDDWILDVQLTGEDDLVLLTAHNVLQVWTVRDGSGEGVLRETHAPGERCILYSGLVVPLRRGTLVMGGTVFSQVLLWRAGGPAGCALEGHKGVIFSIRWDPKAQLIVTTSDDRSVRLWRPKNELTQDTTDVEYWDNASFHCVHILYGHTSRVMRSAIVADMIISVGEDSNICFWSAEGTLLKRIKDHQNGCVWSVDADETHVVTGGADSAVVLHPLSVARDNSQTCTITVDNNAGVPKTILFTARGNMVMYHSNNVLRYYNMSNGESKTIKTYDKARRMIVLSPCKNWIAVVGVRGNVEVYAENHAPSPSLTLWKSSIINVVRVESVHWADDTVFVVSDDRGNISVFDSHCQVMCQFRLPPCRQGWLTAAAADRSRRHFVLGDRCGNIHFYKAGEQAPWYTLRKVHGTCGPTGIHWEDAAGVEDTSTIMTTGRDGTIKYFTLENMRKDIGLRSLQCLKLPFQWVERILDGEQLLVCGFSERNFILYNLTKKRLLVDMACGGGHRAWDVRRYVCTQDDGSREYVQLVYIKDSSVHEATFDMKSVRSESVVGGTHVKEVNSVELVRGPAGTAWVVAAGEDNTVRVSLYDPGDDSFRDKLILKQISSVRTLKCILLPRWFTLDSFLVISGGGRANVCLNQIRYRSGDDVQVENLIDYQVKGTDAERRRATAETDDPEMRIMSLDAKYSSDIITIYAGCSDSVLRVFAFDVKNKTFECIKELTHHSTCILQVRYFSAGYEILVTSTTRGEVSLWDVSNKSDHRDECCRLLRTLHVNSSGINSLSVMKEDAVTLLVAMGGDDNVVTVVRLKVEQAHGQPVDVAEESRWSAADWHSSQVTYVELTPGGGLWSCAGDQRVSCGRLQPGAPRGCLRAQRYTDIADVQGAALLTEGDTQLLCVHGRGLELFKTKGIIESQKSTSEDTT